METNEYTQGQPRHTGTSIGKTSNRKQMTPDGYTMLEQMPAQLIYFDKASSGSAIQCFVNLCELVFCYVFVCWLFLATTIACYVIVSFDVVCSLICWGR